MKKYLLLLTVLFATVATFAQSCAEQQNYRKNYREGELKYIESQNIMTEAEFAEFTVVYNNYNADRSTVRKENKLIKPEQGVELTDEQAAFNVQAKVNKTVKSAELYKNYIATLQTKLTNKQILAIEQAQAKYKKIKFKELSKKSK